MDVQIELEYCKKCQEKLSGNFCPECGSPKELRRIDRQYVVQEVSSVLNFDRGFFYTIKELLIRPGETVRLFIREDRNRLVKPIVFIIICSFVYTLAQQVFHFEDGYVSYSIAEETTTTSILSWVSKNYGYSNILMGIFITLWIKILFRKYAYNFYEILILLCFAMGMGMLLFSLFGITDVLLDIKLIDKGFLVGFVYIFWSIAQFFDKKKFINYPKALLAYILGMLSFTLTVLLIGSLIDWIK